MIRSLVLFLLICNVFCLSDVGDRSGVDSTLMHDNYYEATNSEEDPDHSLVIKCVHPNKNCSELDFNCMSCNYSDNCIYGKEYMITCNVSSSHECLGERIFQKTALCRYCYQTAKWEHTCIQKNNCGSVASPPQYYKTNCTVHRNVICLGHRRFPKRLRCNWTRGHKWSTALILSITLGGFGADRFYLGHWQEGIGKLFSFGGLGVWTLVDVLLISIRYLGPADGSFYV